MNPRVARMNPRVARMNHRVARMNPRVARMNHKVARMNMRGSGMIRIEHEYITENEHERSKNGGQRIENELKTLKNQ